jgi:D-alanyl-D-alanine dipeptidase
MKPILQYGDLVNILTQENGEPMIVVQDAAPAIACQYEKFDMLPYVGDRFVLRYGAVERLKLAAESLAAKKPGGRLRLAYGYRHPEVQRAYFFKRKEEVRAKHPELSENELVAQTHLLTASPDVAGHPTGGAVDITIEMSNGDLDMGTKIADFNDTKRIQTFAEELTETQRQNRLLLREVLSEQCFAPFDGEWWHFSYGDREWAAYYGEPHAMYDQVDFRLK